MKKALLILGLVFTCSLSFAQGISFKKSYGNTGFDFGRGVYQLSDSSYLITGSSSSNSQNSTNAFIMHVDSLGELINTWFYGNSETEWGEKITLGADSSIAIAGYTNSIGNGGFDFYFIKTDIDKNLQIEKSYGGSGWDFAYDLIPLADSGYVIVGETSSFNAIGTDAYMIRIDKFGDTLWSKQYGGLGNDSYKAIKKLTDTEFVVAGAYQHPDSTHISGLVQRIDINGNIIWEELFGESYDQTFYGIDTLEASIILGGERLIENEESKSQYLKLDYDGNLIWEDEQLFTGNSRITSVLGHDLFHSVIVTSETNSPDIPAYADGKDIVVSSYDFYSSSFNLILHKRYGGVGNDEAREIINTLDNGPITVGSTINHSNGGSNVMLIKFGNDLSAPTNTDWELDSILEVEELTILDFEVFPNPVSKELSISRNSNTPSIIHVFDIEGRLISNKKVNSTITKLNVEHWNKGIYFIHLIEEGKLRQVKKFIKQ